MGEIGFLDVSAQRVARIQVVPLTLGTDELHHPLAFSACRQVRATRIVRFRGRWVPIHVRAADRVASLAIGRFRTVLCEELQTRPVVL